MEKTTAILEDELKAYVNPTAKIRQLFKAGELVPIIRGLFEMDGDIPGYYLATIIKEQNSRLGVLPTQIY